MIHSSRAVLLAALLLPTLLLAQSAREVVNVANKREAAAGAKVVLTMIDRKAGLFRLTNHTNKGMILSSVFHPFLKEKFVPGFVNYEMLKKGRWVDIRYPHNGASYEYILPKKKSVNFEITLDAFEYGKVSSGTRVRIKVDGWACEPFVW